MTKSKNTSLKIFCGYLLILALMICCNSVNAQSPCESDDICVVQFNAGFNETNKVSSKYNDANGSYKKGSTVEN